MRAVVYEAFGQAPEVREVPDPACPPDGAVVRVEATGLCRSDWHGWMGHDPDIRLPHVPGHEFAGTILEVGPEVTGWQAGQRVTASFVGACGTCRQCLAGEQQVCNSQQQPGFHYWGSFAEAVVVRRAAVNLVALRDELDFPAAASLGCRFATAYRAVVAQGRLAAGEWLSVFGCGGVGLSAVMIAASRGARVVAVDTSPRALAAAGELGAQVLVDAREANPADAVIAATNGGAHVSIDALGSVDTCISSVMSLRKRGRHIQVGLLPGAASHPPIPMDRVLAQELEIRGSHGMAAHSYPEMLRQVADGSFRLDRLVGSTIGLGDVPMALAAMGSAPATGRITIVVPRLA